MNISLSMRRFNNQTKIFKYPRYNGNDQKVSRTQIVHNITNITTNSHCRYNSAGPREQSVIRLAAEDEDEVPKMPPPPPPAPLAAIETSTPTARLHWSQNRNGVIMRTTSSLLKDNTPPEEVQMTTTALNCYMDLTGRQRAASANPILNTFRREIKPKVIVWSSNGLQSNHIVDNTKTDAYISIGVNEHGESAYNAHRFEDYQLPRKEAEWLTISGTNNAINTAVSRMFTGDKNAMKEIGGVDVNVGSIGSVKALDREYTRIMTDLPKESVRIIRSTMILMQYQLASHVTSMFVPDRPDDAMPVYLPAQNSITIPPWMLRSRLENAASRARLIRMLHNCNLPIPRELTDATNNRDSAPRGNGRNSYAREQYNPRFPGYNKYGKR